MDGIIGNFVDLGVVSAFEDATKALQKSKGSSEKLT
jgi:hypothetical protein